MEKQRSWGENVQHQIKKKSGKIAFKSYFYFTGPIILAKGMICYNVQLLFQAPSCLNFLKMPKIWDTLIGIN